MQKVGVREMVRSYFLMNLDWQKEPSLFKRCKAVGSCAELTTDAYARLLKHFFVPMNVMSVPAFGFLALFYTSPDTSLSTESGIAAVMKPGHDDCRSIMAFGSLGVWISAIFSLLQLSAFGAGQVANLEIGTYPLYVFLVLFLCVQCTFFMMLLRYSTDQQPAKFE